MRKQRYPVTKYYPHWEVKLEPLILMPCTLLSELILLFAESLSPLDPYVVMLYLFIKNQQSMNTSKVLRLPANRGISSDSSMQDNSQMLWVHFLVVVTFCYWIYFCFLVNM